LSAASSRLLWLVTDLGDAVLLLPASLFLLCYFIYLRSNRAAALWASTLALCLGLTVLFKLCFGACGAWVPLLDIHSPSGHTSLSLTFYACCALALSADMGRSSRLIVIVASGVIVAGIAVSRILLSMHTATEVVAGLFIGSCCVAWFGLRYAGLPAALPQPRWPPVLVVLVVLAAATHGFHLGIEDVIMRFANLVRSGVRCV
jgi:membrane-associated phospholipid phosphatase